MVLQSPQTQYKRYDGTQPEFMPNMFVQGTWDE